MFLFSIFWCSGRLANGVKALTHNTTFVRFLSSVDFLMLRKIWTLSKRFTTLTTFFKFSLLYMDTLKTPSCEYLEYLMMFVSRWRSQSFLLHQLFLVLGIISMIVSCKFRTCLLSLSLKKDFPSWILCEEMINQVSETQDWESRSEHCSHACCYAGWWRAQRSSSRIHDPSACHSPGGGNYRGRAGEHLQQFSREDI